MTQRTPAEFPSALVDLRSDTVTHPTAAMYERMRTAPIGDDGLDGDPSVRALEAHVAARLGKDAGLFVPSCTMANLLAVLAQTQRNEQVVLESSAHMYTSERGAATFTGLFYQGVQGSDGAMDLTRLDDALLSGGHRLKTSLVAMETSHNNAGGAVLPLDHMQAVYAMANKSGIPVHLDGARLFNAAVALGVPAAEITQHADTVSLCLSKGLSAPVGAVLVGSKPVMAKARTLRRMLGGTQRQSGIMAAAGLEGVQTMTDRLIEDHVRARRLSDGINGLAPALTATVPQTNIVQVETAGTGMTNAQWVTALQEAGLLTRPWGRTRLRCVTHRHIDDDDIATAVQAFATVLDAR
ncbi:GntG family PLP-dependent aldolase [Achromobacter seleniivolatilans]|uniref:GntG family PLP-dependent aldolase n=1 Tax=Achromobacter seleniivolatilans TaxID=3047478 RepID=A0ABY9LXQ5_9BURK|nr:GntG family PLP-dependent aldolase [Achromobacter sp. R39]WMD19215.1 GntG family PLP-dependent aldolase [Achromobacter sp. R39]